MSDWSAYPMNETVRWPADEKTVGVLGVAPMAAADFFRKLVDRPVDRGWRHLRVLMDSNPKIPSRGRFLELNEADPAPFIRGGLIQLAERGADLVAVICNTAHLLYDRYTEGVPVHVPHMVEVTARGTSRALGGRGRGRVLVLSTALSAGRRLYAPYLEALGLELIDTRRQDLVSQCIEAVKRGYDRRQAERTFGELMKQQPESDAVILGCTELSVLARPEQASPVLIDSNQEMADYCHNYCQGTLEPGKAQL